MQYYKVKPQSDQTKTSLRFKSQILVADELYTSGEVEKALAREWITPKFVDTHFEKKHISPQQTYFFFGARFEVSK
jgi:hypothetical protein